jgi:phosphoribosylanthranilate isomerase
MPTEVKICGLSDEEGVDAALAAGADLVGFNFFPPSPRFVSPARAGELAARGRGKARIVAVTVDADDAFLEEIVGAIDPDFLQLHGKESPERLAAIHARTGRAVMKAIGIAERADLAAAVRYAAAEKLLLDTKPPKNATRPGGNAMAFDWSILEGFSLPRPWFLAGGLNPENVAEALAVSGAPAVDVSSGVERAPGKKEPALIHAFVAAVRAFDRPAQRRVG